ncbi:AAA family ATPase [Bradyrhizobium sp. Pha-3]|uniref:AAA family ATPase n=1 Tax=Bradyrhizobium sp. Pha-3 TaxID=208375 RepID=UPI0035D49812
MVSFPVFQTLTIENYGLFPSSYTRPFNVRFNPGQTVIVGVNGSGKSTMVALLLRMITGPFDLPAGRSEEELGQIRPEAARFDKHGRSYFALRVADGAKSATARLVVKFGSKALVIQRRLSDLSLVSATVAREPVSLDEDETNYQKTLANCLGVDTFFDALIILRYLTFMLEDRRSLVWDKTAQRQIFRVLVLPPEEATRLAVAQQQLISTDSAYRNTFNMITRRKKEQEQASHRVEKLLDVEAELRIKQAEVNANRDQLERVGVLRIRFDKERREARLQKLSAAEAREASLRELERIKMQSLKNWFEPSNETAHYIVAHLLAEQQCLLCGADPAPNAEDLARRLTLLTSTTIPPSKTLKSRRLTGSLMLFKATRKDANLSAIFLSKIQRPLCPGSISVGGAFSKTTFAALLTLFALRTSFEKSRVTEATSYVATLASARSAKYGFTSMNVGWMPRNWQASAVVPEPENGSIHR